MVIGSWSKFGGKEAWRKASKVIRGSKSLQIQDERAVCYVIFVWIVKEL